MKTSNHIFPLYSNSLVDSAMARARIERSKAFYSMFEGLFGRRETRKKLSDG